MICSSEKAIIFSFDLLVRYVDVKTKTSKAEWENQPNNEADKK